MTSLCKGEKVIAHIDMDCFYAACEEKYNPSLKNKPVAIGALPSSKRGVLCTANYNARKYGLRSAMPISKAVQLCPDAVYLKPNFELYMNESAKVMHLLKQYATSFEQVSVDEAYLDISAFAKRFPNLESAALEIQKSVFELTSLSCSIGVSCSRFVSKIASDFKKPAGVTVVTNPKDFLADLQIEKISGVGKKTAARMNELGIYTINDLANYNRFKLIDNFGDWVIGFQEIARGNDATGVSEEIYEKKSISKEMTFEDDITIEECFLRIDELVETIDFEGYCFKTISLKLRFSDFSTFTRDLSCKIPVSSKTMIKNATYHLLNKLNINTTKGVYDKRVRLIGIKLSKLTPEQYKQLDLFVFG